MERVLFLILFYSTRFATFLCLDDVMLIFVICYYLRGT